MTTPTQQPPSDSQFPHTSGLTGASDLPATNPTPASSTEALRLAQQAVGKLARFTVLRPHAKGGLGEVLVAEDAELHREVAFKRIKPQLANSAGARRRFLLEAEITAKLEHPGIVPIYGLVHDADGQPCYAMRFIEGDSLREAIRQFHEQGSRSRAPSATYDGVAFRQLLARFITVCQTVAYAHSRGIIHRDLKPANVMLGRFGETLVVDWGLAKPFERSETDRSSGEVALALAASDDSDATQMGHAIGTPAYMAPEQAAGQWNVVGPTSDVYSLGAIFYEMLTGDRPLHGQDALEVVQHVQQGEFPRPRQRRYDVPQPLEAICLKAMAQKPDQRYATANALASDVEHWLAGEPVAAWHEPWTVRARRWMRKHRTLVAVAATALLLAGLAAGLVAGLLTAQNAELATKNSHLTVARDRQREARERADQRFALAQEAVDQYLNQVTNNRKLTAQDFHDLRKELLQAAAPFYEKLSSEKAESPEQEADCARAYQRLAFVRGEMGERQAAIADLERARSTFAKLAGDFPATAEFRQELARSNNSLGALLHHTGRLPEAETAFNAALALQKLLVAEFPSRHEFRRDLGRSQGNLGNLLSVTRRVAEAEKAYAAALTVQQQLAAEFPDQSEFRGDLANCHGNLGLLLHNAGRLPEAETAYQAALKIRSQLAAEFPTQPEFRRDLAKCHNYLALVFSDMGRTAEGQRAYAAALPIQEQLAADFPSVPGYRTDLAGSYVNYGSLISASGETVASLPWYAKAIALLEPLVGREPHLVIERLYLRNAHAERAQALDKLGRSADAVKDWDRAIELNAEAQRQTWFRAVRARSLAGAGEHAKAVAEVNLLIGAKDADAGLLYDLACICALASAAVKDAKNSGTDATRLAEEYAAHAALLLRQAVAKGFKDIEHLKKDEDLKPLREREDFKKLLKELEEKQ